MPGIGSWWLAGLLFAGSALGQPVFQGLGDLSGGDFYSTATGVSADGRMVVGVSASMPGNPNEAFRWTAGSGMVGMGYLSEGAISRASAASQDGAVIVGAGDIAPGSIHPFRWDCAGGMKGIAGTGSAGGAYGVSADGIVCVGHGEQGAFRWTEQSGLVFLTSGTAYGISADSTVVVGANDTPVAFRWTAQTGAVTLNDFDGGPVNCTAWGVSADGQTVVGYGFSAKGVEAAYWFGGVVPTSIGDLDGGGFASEALAVSADGTAIVGWGTTADGQAAFLWTVGGGMVSVQDALIGMGTQGLEGWILTAATGISANGTVVVGEGVNPQGQTEAWIAGLTGPLALCYADCDRSCGQAGVLNLFDFLCYVNRFNAGDGYADCTGEGGLDLFDFLCFVNQFNAGC